MQWRLKKLSLALFPYSFLLKYYPLMPNGYTPKHTCLAPFYLAIALHCIEMRNIKNFLFVTLVALSLLLVSEAVW